MVVRVSGFSEKLPMLLGQLLTFLNEFSPSEAKFEIMKELVARSQSNACLEPGSYANHIRSKCLFPGTFLPAELLATLPSCTHAVGGAQLGSGAPRGCPQNGPVALLLNAGLALLTDTRSCFVQGLRAYLARSYESLRVDMYAHGNLSEDSARELCRYRVTQALRCCRCVRMCDCDCACGCDCACVGVRGVLERWPTSFRASAPVAVQRLLEVPQGMTVVVAANQNTDVRASAGRARLLAGGDCFHVGLRVGSGRMSTTQWSSTTRPWSQPSV
jgi:hypothetical protein